MMRSILLGLALLLACAAQAAPLAVPDEIIVKYKSGNRFADHGEVVRRHGRHVEVLRHAEGGAFQSVDAGRWERLQQRIARIRRDGNVLYAEPNYYGRFAETIPTVPSDPSYTSQWWLPAVGDRTLWALGKGKGVIVAVIDTGVDLTHPDLTANLLANGYNYGDGNATPQDVLGHGTKVAGIIAALQNNGVGVSGLAPDTKILPIKINPGGQGTFTSDKLARAIEYAVDNGAKIINLSLTVDSETQTVRNAIQSALDKGVVMVAASGNESTTVAFPANMTGVIGVGATGQAGGVASFSNTGPELTVAAPGVNVFSTVLGGGFGAGSGTSFAAPVVSATLACMLSINPSLSADTLAKSLRTSATALSGYTYGNLNAGAAGNMLVPHLQIGKSQFTAADSVAVDFALPPTGAAVDVYVTVQTPFGDFSLRADGTWTPVVQGDYRPVALGYQNGTAANGTLFGSAGIFPSIALASFPAGTYTWNATLVGSATGKVIGDTMTSVMRLN